MSGPAWTSRPAPAVDWSADVPGAIEATRRAVKRRPDPQPAVAEVRAALAGLAVPPGSLGGLVPPLLALARARTTPPQVPARPAVVVLAGDHGIHAQGVSPWPQELSATVAGLVAEGRAALSALARAAEARVVVVDVGLAHPPPDAPALIARPVVRGTRDPLAAGSALQGVEVDRAIATGIDLAGALIDDGADLLVLGDVGLANTTTSAALLAASLDRPADGLTGPGSGVDAATLDHKRTVVARLAAAAAGRDPLERLAVLGGCEHAAGVGVLLAAAARRVPVVLDGLISAATAVLAVELEPRAHEVLIAGHRSPEPGASAGLAALQLDPVLDLELRVGEGTGGALAVGVIRAATRLLHEVATLAEVTAGPAQRPE